MPLCTLCLASQFVVWNCLPSFIGLLSFIHYHYPPSLDFFDNILRFKFSCCYFLFYESYIIYTSFLRVLCVSVINVLSSFV